MKKKPTIKIQGEYELRDSIELGVGDLTIRVSGGEYTV